MPIVWNKISIAFSMLGLRTRRAVALVVRVETIRVFLTSCAVLKGDAGLPVPTRTRVVRCVG